MMEVRIPGEHDVLCGRGGATNNHIGNKRFRSIVAEHQPEYLQAKKRDKSAIARGIVELIRSRGGRFLKKLTDDQWIEVGDRKASEKTSQALREGLDVRSHTTASATTASGQKMPRRDDDVLGPAAAVPPGASPGFPAATTASAQFHAAATASTSQSSPKRQRTGESSSSSTSANISSNTSNNTPLPNPSQTPSFINHRLSTNTNTADTSTTLPDSREEHFPSLRLLSVESSVSIAPNDCADVVAV